MKLVRTSGIVLAVSAALTAATVDWAGGQLVQRMDPSVRAAGMGGVSTAVFWDPASASWENPALLGYQHGTEYSWARHECFFYEGLCFRANRLALGWGGVGLMLAGWPADGLGGHSYEVDHVIEILNEIGEPVGSIPYHLEEDATTVGVGVNLLEFVSHLHPRLSSVFSGAVRFGDLSIGYTVTDVEALSKIGDECFDAEATTKDYGLLAHLTPYNSVDSAGRLPILDASLESLVGGIRIDGAYGYSEHNFEEAKGTSNVTETSHPLRKLTCRGGALRLTTGIPSAVEGWLISRSLSWLCQRLTPLISWGIGWDSEDWTDYFLDTEAHGTREETGWELTIANVFTVRRGDVDNSGRGIDYSTSGWGLGFKAGGLCALRYDEATIPDSFSDGNVMHKAFTIILHPAEVWRTMEGL